MTRPLPQAIAAIVADAETEAARIGATPAEVAANWVWHLRQAAGAGYCRWPPVEVVRAAKPEGRPALGSELERV